MRRHPAWLFLSLVSALPGLALAEEPKQSDQALHEVVVTATRVPTPIPDIPAGVSVVDRQTIETRDYNTLVEALSAIPGVRVSPSGGAGGNASIFVRGGNSNHVLVLRDGMPINDGSESSGAFNFGVDTLSDIERIEVIRGPMAALYGSGAITGVINLISRRGTQPGLHIESDLAGGYPAQVRGAVNASGIAGKFDYSLTAESQSQRGYDATPQRMSIYTGTPDGFRDRIGTLNLGYSPVPGTRLSLFVRARQAIFGFDALGSPTFDASNSTGHDDSVLGRIGITSSLLGGSLETGLFLGRLQDDRRYTELLDPRDPNQASNDSRYHSGRTDLQWNNTLYLSDFFSFAALSDAALTFGYERTQDSVRVRVNQSFFGTPFAQSADASMTTDALYTGLQGTLWRRITVTSQVRQDWVAGQTPTTWRIGGVVHAPEIDTDFKLAYGTAFRAPSLFDRFGVDSFGYMGNPALKPESASGWEAGFTTTVPAFGRPDAISFGATYFNEQVNNLIVAVFTPVNTAVNIGSAHLQGVETSLTLRPARWLTMQAAWTYTQAQNADTGSELLRRPQHTGSLDATIIPIPGLTIAPELLFTGTFQDFLIDNGGFDTGLVGTSRQGIIANLTVTYDVMPHVQVYANGRNLFYSRFEPVNGYQTPGPSFVAGVRLRL